CGIPTICEPVTRKRRGKRRLRARYTLFKHSKITLTNTKNKTIHINNISLLLNNNFCGAKP
ncbi:hypothetical protein, partial [Klebsiella pneumoniae]